MAQKKKPVDGEKKRGGGLPNHAQLVSMVKTLQSQVAALGNGSTSPSPLSSTSAPPAAPSFQTWLLDALVAYLGSAGPSIVGPASIADTADALGNVWITYLLANGATNEEIQDFKVERDAINKRAQDWLALTKGDRYAKIRQRQEREGIADITAPEANPPEVDPNVQKAVAAALQNLFGQGQMPSPPQAPTPPTPLSAAEQMILEARTGGMPTR